MKMSLPPEVQARIAAMPPAQQAQMQSMMGGAAGGTPVASTNKSCIASQESMDTLMNQASKKSGMKCTFYQSGANGGRSLLRHQLHHAAAGEYAGGNRERAQRRSTCPTANM